MDLLCACLVYLYLHDSLAMIRLFAHRTSFTTLSPLVVVVVPFLGVIST